MDSLTFFSHTEFSEKFLPAGLGEAVHAAKLRQLLTSHYKVNPVIDIFQLFEERKLIIPFQKLALTNYELASGGHDVLEECEALNITDLQIAKETIGFVFSWGMSLAGLWAAGIRSRCPIVAKLYAFHPDEKIVPKLYEPAQLIITESLLGNLRAIDYGIEKGKVVYLPHHFPLSVESIKKEKAYYLSHLEKNMGRSLEKNRLIIGCVSRLQYRKNIEYALNALDRFSKEYPEVKFYFILKGKLDPTGEWPSSHSYHEWLKEKVSEFGNREWFLWDQEKVPYEEALRQYGAFDLGLHLSGAEGASNTVVDFLALGIPTIVLEASTNPYLFKNATCFVQKGPMRPGPLPFNTPDEEDLYLKMKNLLLNSKQREELGLKAKEIAWERFHPERTLERMPLLLEAIKEKKAHKKIEELFKQDLKIYDV